MRDDRFHCPVEVATSVLSGKWTAVVLSHIKEGSIRYSELSRRIPDITDKMLSQRLRSLEDDGLIARARMGTAPPHVEYRLTPAGESLRPVLQALYDWGEHWATTEGLLVDPVPPPPAQPA